jgi:hypothetical protein
MGFSGGGDTTAHSLKAVLLKPRKGTGLKTGHYKTQSTA